MRRIPRQDDEIGQTVVAESDPQSGGDKAERVLTICNRRGLHARASARFVQTVDQFDAEVTVKRDGMSVGGLSIMGLMMLAATKGSDIHVSATGAEAGAVVKALADLVNDRFGEDC